MRDIYNSKVVHAEYVTRPLGNKDTGKNVPLFHHAGVRVTTDSGEKYLIHKGPEYGISSDTVVTSDRYMSNRWTTAKGKDIGGSTVGDFVKNGYPDEPYSVWTSNCQHAANSMYKKND